MALDPGQFPSDLATGDHVRLIVTSNPDATGQSATTMVDDPAVVWSVVRADDGVATVITVRGPIALSTEIAAAAKVQLATVEGA